jgi:hydroxymethylbilane synthase
MSVKKEMPEQMAKAGTVRLRIGTRGSALALAQARELKERLVSAQCRQDSDVEIVAIETTGDRITNRSLTEIGGKGLFTAQIEQRLGDGRIDMAVHSSKDMPSILPDGLELSCFLPRESPEDCLVSHRADSIETLPEGAVVGSASLRRGALIRRIRPDVRIVNFRGNVHSRLRKLDEGDVDATILALAGLNRLGLAERVARRLPVDTFPPAPGQGAICVETRTGDNVTTGLLRKINDPATAAALACERSFLAGLDGSCRTPIAGLAVVDGAEVVLHGMVLKPDGSEMHELWLSGPVGEAAAIGAQAAQKLRRDAGANFFESWH